MGATHKAAMLEHTTPPRIPTIHQLNNYITNTRRRLKHIEDVEGATKCTKILLQLQGSSSNPPASTKVVVEDQAAPSDSDDEELETEEDILARQVAENTPEIAPKPAVIVQKV
jgi:hypothetical protein